MNKPTLSQIVGIVQQQSYHLWVCKCGVYSFVPCQEAVERFGDVEVHHLGFRLSSLKPYEPCNEFKAMIEVFI